MATRTKQHEPLYSFKQMCRQVTDRTGRKFTGITWQYLAGQQRLDTSTFQRVGATLIFREEDIARVEAIARSMRQYKTAPPEAQGATS